MQTVKDQSRKAARSTAVVCALLAATATAQSGGWLPVTKTSYFVLTESLRTPPVEYGHALQLGFSPQGCKTTITFTDTSNEGSVYLILATTENPWHNGSVIVGQSDVNTNPVLEVDGDVPTPQDWTLWVMNQASPPSGKAGPGLLSFTSDSSCRSQHVRESKGLPMHDPSIPLVTTTAGDPIVLTITEVAAPGALDKTSDEVPPDQYILGIPSGNTAAFNMSIKSHPAGANKCEDDPVYYQLYGVYSSSFAQFCKPSFANTQCGEVVMESCTVPANEAFVVKHHFIGPSGVAIPVAVAPSVQVADPNGSECSKRRRCQAGLAPVRLDASNNKTHSQLLRQAHARMDPKSLQSDSPQLPDVPRYSYASSTEAMRVENIRYRSEATVLINQTTECYVDLQFVPDNNSQPLVGMYAQTTDGQLLASSFVQQSPRLTVNNQVASPRPLSVSVYIGGGSSPDASATGFLLYSARGSCSDSPDALVLAVEHPEYRSIRQVISPQQMIDGNGPSVGAPQLVSISNGGYLTMHATDAPAANTQILLQNPYAMSASKLRFVLQNLGAAECGGGGMPAYSFKNVTTSRGAIKIADAAASAVAPCGESTFEAPMGAPMEA